MKQFTVLQEGSNRILSKVQKSFWSCRYTTYQSTYFIDDFIQGVIKNSKNQGNPTSTAKDMHRTSINVKNNLFLHHITFKSETTRI